MASLNESIATLERLVAKADEYQRRYEIELMAHRDVRDRCKAHLVNEQDQAWYEASYAEAQLKQQCNPDREEL